MIIWSFKKYICDFPLFVVVAIPFLQPELAAIKLDRLFEIPHADHAVQVPHESIVPKSITPLGHGSRHPSADKFIQCSASAWRRGFENFPEKPPPSRLGQFRLDEFWFEVEYFEEFFDPNFSRHIWLTAQ